MRELIEVNRWTHDFTAAMWCCGSVLIWLLCREAVVAGSAVEAARRILGSASKVAVLTIPSLVITLMSGAVRAFTFTTYEYVGPITTSMIVILVVKHVVFVCVIVWGIAVHRRAGRLRAALGDGGRTD